MVDMEFSNCLPHSMMTRFCNFFSCLFHFLSFIWNFFIPFCSHINFFLQQIFTGHSFPQITELSSYLSHPHKRLSFRFAGSFCFVKSLLNWLSYCISSNAIESILRMRASLIVSCIKYNLIRIPSLHMKLRLYVKIPSNVWFRLIFC